MNQGDRAWHYSTGPHGVVRRVAVVVDLFDSGDKPRVNLAIYARGPLDQPNIGGPVVIMAAVPVRLDYVEGGPVAMPFCAPVDKEVLIINADHNTPALARAFQDCKSGDLVCVPGLCVRTITKGIVHNQPTPVLASEHSPD